MRRALIVSVLLCGIAFGQTAGNLLPNGSFEFVEPPAPTPQQAATGEAAPPEAWLPRTWHVWSQWGATWKCPVDPAQAHSGQRCVQLLAKQGQAWLRYGPMPVADSRPWTIQFWARGQGKLALTAHDATKDPWQAIPVGTCELQPDWTQVRMQWTPPAECRKWLIDLTNQGVTECFVDDVSVGAEGATPPPWPPDTPLARDAHTLLLLDFAQPLNEDAFYVGGQVKLTDDNQPGFGKALLLGPEAYVACSADENLNSLCGTIEVWVKLLSPGNNGIQQPFVSIPGMEGMWLGKDQYSHVGFSFSTGWHRLSGATAMGYAHGWQPCWRHVAACWDAEALAAFVDGKLVAWQSKPKLSRFLGPELRLGSPGMMMDDLRISDTVRYRVPIPSE